MWKIIVLLVVGITLVGTGQTCADAPATQPALSSKAVENDGLQVMVTLPKTTFAVNEPLKFTVQFRNASKKAFLLSDLDYYWNWQMRFEDQATNGAWLLHRLPTKEHFPFRPTPVQAKTSPEILVALDHSSAESFNFEWAGLQHKEIQPVENLPAGRYRLTLQIDLKADAGSGKPAFPIWVGQITSQPVDFEISDQGIPTPQVSKAVRGNEADFQLVAPVIWLAPTGKDDPTFVPLGLRVTNRSSKPLQLNLGDAVHLVDATGKELPIKRDRDAGFPFKAPLVQKDQSVTIDRHASLEEGTRFDTFRLGGSDGLAGVWWFENLTPGKYTLYMTYHNTPEATQRTLKAFEKPTVVDPKEAPFWLGQVTTEALAIEIKEKPAAPFVQPATAEAAWKAVLLALRAGDKHMLAKVTTDKGYTAIMGEDGNEKMTPTEMKVQGRVWRQLPLQFNQESQGKVTATGHIMAPTNGLRLVFIKTAEGWKLDQWTPGE